MFLSTLFCNFAPRFNYELLITNYLFTFEGAFHSQCKTVIKCNQ